MKCLSYMHVAPCSVLKRPHVLPNTCLSLCRSPVGQQIARSRSAVATAATAAVVAAATTQVVVRGVCCRATGDATAPSSSSSTSAAEGQTQQAAAASPAAAQSSFSDAELRQLWDSVSRSLLKLGKSGLSASHVNSLKELLTAHKLVKVDLNGARSDAGVAAAAAQVEAQLGASGKLLQVKGRTLLVASGSSSSEQLLAVAEASSASTAVWKAKRQIKKAEAAAKREGASSQGGS